MMESILKGRRKEMGDISGLMEISLRVNGRIVISMDLYNHIKITT